MVFSRYSAVLRSCVRNLTSSRAVNLKTNVNKTVNDFESLSVNTILTRKCRKKYYLDNKNCYSTLGNESKNDINSHNEKIEILGLNDPDNKEPPTPILIPFSTPKNMDSDLFDNSDSLPDFEEKRPGALDTCTEDLSHIGPRLGPTFNFAAYANQSETIQRLAELGVDFSKLEKRKGIAQFLMPLDFEKDMKMHIRFLSDCGVPAERLGDFLTQNPLIFKEDLDDLHTRIRYLGAHKFTPSMITRIVTQNPFWIMFSTKRIDGRLGFFQREFGMSGDEIRALSTKLPRIITYRMGHLKESTFAVREEMGFDTEQTKRLLLGKPRIWMKSERVDSTLSCVCFFSSLTYRFPNLISDRPSIVNCFDYAHNEMKLPHEIIVQQPEILTCRLQRLKPRHMFLVTLGRAQYDPTKPMYISLKSLVSHSDAEFCTTVAKTPVETYNMFLKSL